MGSAPMVYNLDPAQRLSAIRYLILEISVITGWPIPAAEVKNILVKEFEALLLEQYPILNINEIALAFRKYGTRTKDWGKEMNLSLITEVLDSYWSERSETKRSVSESPENAQIFEVFTDEEMDNELRGEIQGYLNHKFRGIENPRWLDLYTEILIKDGFIKNATQKDQFIDYLIKNNIQTIYEAN